MSQTKTIGPGRTQIWFSEQQLAKAEMVELGHGTFHAFAQLKMGEDSGFSFSLTTEAEYEAITTAFPEN